MGETNQGPPGLAANGSGRDSSERKRILIAESDGFTRLVLIFLLRIAGWSVDFAATGALALRKLRSSTPDVLLVELKLCGVSGLELIRSARREPQFGNRPIYVFKHADLINRSTRKELQKRVTDVFDKSCISIANFVQRIRRESKVIAEAQ